MYFSNICKSLVHARSSWRHEDYTAEWADIASALKDSWPPLPNFSLEWCIDSHMQRHTQTHTPPHRCCFLIFFKEKNREISKSLPTALKNRGHECFIDIFQMLSFMNEGFLCNLIVKMICLREFREKKKTILSGCFLHEKKDYDDALSISNCSFWTRHAHNHSNENTISNSLFLHRKTWPGTAHSFGYIYMINILNAGNYNHDI